MRGRRLTSAFGALRERPRRTVVLLGIVLIAGGWLVGSWWFAERHRKQRDERIRAEAVEFSNATGASMDASVAICTMGVNPDHLQKLPMDELKRWSIWYSEFEGKDRRRVAGYCNALFHPASIRNFRQEQMEIARNATREIIGEFWNDPKIIGQAYLIAVGLGMRNEPYIQEMALETIQAPGMAPELISMISHSVLSKKKSEKEK